MPTHKYCDSRENSETFAPRWWLQGISLLLQSDHAFPELCAHIETFLVRLEAVIAGMSDADFNTHVASLISSLVRELAKAGRPCWFSPLFRLGAYSYEPLH